MASAEHFNRRQFCQLTVAGLGGSLVSTRGYAQPVPPTAPKAKESSTVTENIEPLPFVPGSYTFAILPDTQGYFSKNHRHFQNQTQWIVENADAHQIKYVIHLGDMTQLNKPDQWKAGREAMKKLDGKVPYLVATGNHDYGRNGDSSSRETYYNDYFPLSDQKRLPSFGGAMEADRGENAYHTFRAGNHDYLLVSLEWAPRDHTVAWANEVVAKYPNHRAVLITHAYLYYDNTRYDWEKKNIQQRSNPHVYGLAQLPGGVNDGEQLWHKLVSKHPNFFLTHNGHVAGDGTGRLTSVGEHGQTVHQILANYQRWKEGGQGFLRLIEFLPDDKTIQVKTYSPSLDEYRTDDENQFVLSLENAAATAKIAR